VHARRFVEDVDLDAGIIRHADEAGGFRVVARLQSRILGEGGAGFLGLRNRPEIVQVTSSIGTPSESQ
jgi:hypothetical protein